MKRSLRTRGAMLLAVVGLLLAGLPALARSPAPYEETPPGVSTPPGDTTGCTTSCTCTNSCGGCTGPNCGTPPGSNNMPEPATLVSGLIGAGLASLYSLRRRRTAQDAQAQ